MTQIIDLIQVASLPDARLIFLSEHVWERG